MESWFGKPDAKFIFQCKLYTDTIINSKDPKIVHMLFTQAVYNIITGTYPTTEKDAVQLAAWQFQAKFGGHNPASHRPGFLTQSLVEYVPGPYMERAGKKSSPDWEQLIFHKHAFSTSGTPREAYATLLAKRDYYGAVMFAVKQKYDRQLPRKLFLGISRRGILLLRIPVDPLVEDMETLARFPLVRACVRACARVRSSTCHCAAVSRARGLLPLAAPTLPNERRALLPPLPSPPLVRGGAGGHLPVGVQAGRELLL